MLANTSPQSQGGTVDASLSLETESWNHKRMQGLVKDVSCMIWREGKYQVKGICTNMIPHKMTILVLILMMIIIFTKF